MCLCVLSTNATLVCVLSVIKSAVILSTFVCMCSVRPTEYRRLDDGDIDRRESLHDGRSTLIIHCVPKKHVTTFLMIS